MQILQKYVHIEIYHLNNLYKWVRIGRERKTEKDRERDKERRTVSGLRYIEWDSVLVFNHNFVVDSIRM